jgi:hypothetical protein
MLSSNRHIAALLLTTGAAFAQAASPNLCEPTERTFFSCTFEGGKAVALCGRVDSGTVISLEYRYGRPGRIELTHAATPQSAFSATVAPLAPRASVRQVWFTRGGYTYLLTQCVGGGCPKGAGLAVLKGDRVVSNRFCQRSVDDRAWFAPELAQFGSDASGSRSATPLIALDDVDLSIERLYPER